MFPFPSREKRETLDKLRRRFVTWSTAILVLVILGLIAVQVITTRIVTDHAANNEPAAVAPVVPSTSPSPSPSAPALSPAPTPSPALSGWPAAPSPTPTPTPLGDGWGSVIAEEEADKAGTVEGAEFWDRIRSGKSLRATITGNIKSEDCEGLKTLYGAISRSPGPHGEPEDVALVLQ